MARVAMQPASAGGIMGDADRFDFAYGADYPLIEPDFDEEFEDEEFGGTEEDNS